jgi:Subtilase family
MRPRDGTAAPKNKRDISEVQVTYILDNFPDDAAIYPPRLPGARGPEPVEFVYRRRTVLTRNEDLQRVLAVIPTIPSGDTPVRVGEVTQPVPGLALIPLLIEGQPSLVQEGEVTFAVLEELERRLGPGRVAPDHMMSVAVNPPAGNCPATEPDPVPGDAAPHPGISRSGCDGQGTLVAVVDTGLVENAVTSHRWLHGVTGDPDTQVSNGDIRRYGGHGTFIASIVRAMAPQAEVRVKRIFEKAGALFESDIVKALLPVLDWAPDVISLSAGSHTWKYRGSLSFYVFVKDHLSQHPDTVLVAAAGNDGADWRFSPAEMDEVIGVGALGEPGDARAWFSDYGDWVKVYAPGQNLVHAFASGKYEYQELRAGQHAVFYGMARWSGTSFSTPVVSGLIAARMSGTGQSAPEAAESLLELARAQALPDVGPVLHPGQACLCAHASGHEAATIA